MTSGLLAGYLFTAAWIGGFVGLAVLLWKVGLQGLFDGTAWFIHRLAHGPDRRPVPARTPPPVLSASTCRHPRPPEPVEVHDGPNGATEVVGWLCPDCRESVPAPRPKRAPGDDGTFGFIREDLRVPPRRWDTEYLEREVKALTARLDVIVDGVGLDERAGAISIPKAHMDEAKQLLERLTQLRTIMEERAAEAAWSKLSEAEKARRNATAARLESFVAGGIVSPREAMFLRNDATPQRMLGHGPTPVCDHYFASDASGHVARSCARCGATRKEARRGR